MRPFGKNAVSLRESITERSTHNDTVQPLFLLQQQRHQELMRQAEQGRLVRIRRSKPESSEQIFQQLLWWVEGALLVWGCALQQAGRATKVAEKGYCVCP
jgi:hypothetical protein